MNATETTIQHTAGPWQVAGEGNRVVTDNRRSRRIIAEIECQTLGHPSPQDDEGYANARLIAAAPQALEALRCAAGLLEQLLAADGDSISLDRRQAGSIGATAQIINAAIAAATE